MNRRLAFLPLSGDAFKITTPVYRHWLHEENHGKRRAFEWENREKEMGLILYHSVVWLTVAQTVLSLPQWSENQTTVHWRQEKHVENKVKSNNFSPQKKTSKTFDQVTTQSLRQTTAHMNFIYLVTSRAARKWVSLSTDFQIGFKL